MPIKGQIKYVNLHGLFIIVLAWNSNDVMAMPDPQAQFFRLNCFLSFFLFGINLVAYSSLDIHLWIFIFACTTTLRDFSILQAITTFILTSDISL